MKPANSHIPTSILTINGGSSSIKFALYQADEPLKRELHGKIDRIGLSGTNLTFKDPARNQEESLKLDVSDHKSAATFLMDWLQKQTALESVLAVGHRVVHGMQHTVPELITQDFVG
jgi:acetate kinase